MNELELLAAMVLFGYSAAAYSQRFVIAGMPADLAVGVAAGVVALIAWTAHMTFGGAGALEVIARIVGTLALAGIASWLHFVAVLWGTKDSEAKKADK